MNDWSKLDSYSIILEDITCLEYQYSKFWIWTRAHMGTMQSFHTPGGQQMFAEVEKKDYVSIIFQKEKTRIPLKSIAFIRAWTLTSSNGIVC